MLVFAPKFKQGLKTNETNGGEEALAPVRRGGPAPFSSYWPQKVREWATSSCLKGRLEIQPESGCTSIPSHHPWSQSLAALPAAGHRFTPPRAALEGVVRRPESKSS